MFRIFILLNLSSIFIFADNLLNKYQKIINLSINKASNDLAVLHHDFIGAYSKPVISIYIIFIGYKILYGKEKISIETILKLGVLVPLLITLSLDINLFNSWIYYPINGFFDGLSSKILAVSSSSTGNTFEQIGDNMMNIVFLGWKQIDEAGWGAFSAIFIGTLKVLSGIMVIFSVTIIITRSLILTFIYAWIFSFTLWLLPLNTINKVPKNAFVQFLAYSMHIPLLTFILVLFDLIIREFANFNDSNAVEDILFILLASYSFIKILDQIGEIAGAITGGQSNSTGANMTSMAMLSSLGSGAFAKSSASDGIGRVAIGNVLDKIKPKGK
jgi:hypothetical protein